MQAIHLHLSQCKTVNRTLQLRQSWCPKSRAIQFVVTEYFRFDYFSGQIDAFTDNQRILEVCVSVIYWHAALYVKLIFFFLSYLFCRMLSGAVGSTMLAYILPCLIHLRLGGRSRPALIIVKDVLLIFFGLVGMLTGVYSSVDKIIDNFNGK